MENMQRAAMKADFDLKLPYGNFSCKAHNYAWLASDIMRPAQPDRAGAD
jgi:hypothetical protein